MSSMVARAGLSKLEAISMIESGNNDWAVGEAGEVSRYQIMPRVWKRYTSSTAYHDAEMSARVASRHLHQLEESFRQRTGREPTDFDRYVLWNGGPTYYAKIGFSSARVHRVIRERAKRFVNLREMAIAKFSPAPVRPPPQPFGTPMLALGTVSLLSSTPISAQQRHP
jgi:hypothetical protein